MKKAIIIVAVLSLIIALSFSLAACSTTSFDSITGIKNFKDISKVVIVNNVDIIDGHVGGAITKSYDEENDILAIYNILSSAKYSKVENAKSEPSSYEIRIYVNGKVGYISYSWDNRFEGVASYNGKLKDGAYSMLDAHIAEEELVKIFYRD